MTGSYWKVSCWAVPVLVELPPLIVLLEKLAIRLAVRKKPPARIEAMPIVSVDAALDPYGVTRLW